MKPSLAFGIKTVSIVAAAVALAFLFNAVRPQISVQPQASGPAVENPAPGGEISLEDAEALYRVGEAVFLDARDPEEYEKGHIEGALSLPPAAFTREFPDVRAKLEHKTAITYCDGEFCELSHELAQQLVAAGVADVRVLKNGWSLWKENLPTATGTEPAPDATMGATFDTAPDADIPPDADNTTTPATEAETTEDNVETPAVDFESTEKIDKIPAADSEITSENGTPEVSTDAETAPDADLTIDTNASETP